LATAGLHQVAHVEQNQCRQAQRQYRRGQHQLAGQVKGVEDQQHGIRLRRAGHFASQHIDSDTGILGIGRKRVDAGQVDEGQVRAADASHQAHALFDSDAGVVGDLLTETGQAIEKSGLTGVRRPDQYNGPERPGWGRRGGRHERRWGAASAHRTASISSATSAGSGAFAS
jgi:hypothetical protein